MRFKEFIREARHREDISIEKAIELLEKHCGEAYKHFDEPLWRGSRRMTEDAYLVSGEDGNRTSANTKNYYTLVMDHFLPELGYPKRSKSIIMGNTKNLEYVQAYGTTYAVFPYDGVKIGVCEHEDLWYSKIQVGNEKHPMTVEQLNRRFYGFDLDDSTYQDFKNSIITKMNDTSSIQSIVTGMFGKDPSKVESILKAAYSPESLKLHLATTSDIKKYDDNKRELWIGGKCIAIKRATWLKMMEDRK